MANQSARVSRIKPVAQGRRTACGAPISSTYRGSAGTHSTRFSVSVGREKAAVPRGLGGLYRHVSVTEPGHSRLPRASCSRVHRGTHPNMATHRNTDTHLLALWRNNDPVWHLSQSMLPVSPGSRASGAEDNIARVTRRRWGALPPKHVIQITLQSATTRQDASSSTQQASEGSFRDNCLLAVAAGCLLLAAKPHGFRSLRAEEVSQAPPLLLQSPTHANSRLR